MVIDTESEEKRKTKLEVRDQAHIEIHVGEN